MGHRAANASGSGEAEMDKAQGKSNALQGMLGRMGFKGTVESKGMGTDVNTTPTPRLTRRAKSGAPSRIQQVKKISTKTPKNTARFPSDAIGLHGQQGRRGRRTA